MTNESPARLQWACRRGMLELDLLLQPFAAQIFPQLPVDEQNTFRRLLECNDQQLYDWLVKQVEPDDIALAAMIKRVRQRV